MSMSQKRLTPGDGMFLYMETPETMMHVAGLLPFSPPPDAPPDLVRGLVDEIRDAPVFPPWNRRLSTPDVLLNPLQSWIEEQNLDLEVHVRRSALPSPGDQRELGVLVQRLHEQPIDFRRPPWELHLLEGLEGGRFAMYAKVHHALVDGYTAMRLLARSLSTDPAERERPLFFSVPPKPRDHREPGAPGLHFPELMAAVRAQYGSAVSFAKAFMNVARAARSRESELVTPLSAPKCVLNAKIGRGRRFATQSLDLARLRAVGKAANGTVNDVVLALSGASLRRYLMDRNALPDAPLVALSPVNVRPKDDPGGGNAVGAMLASLATNVADPAERLAAIIASTKSAKEQLQGMSKAAILQYSALLVSPFMLQLIPGAAGRVPPAFNVVISNVPGPEEPLYFRGARLEASYPVSIPVHGMALNITCGSYAGAMNFGFIGCRDTLPSLQRLAVYCGEALVELEKALL
jgi:WS/DGAT/MGAT family acyltransferase